MPSVAELALHPTITDVIKDSAKSLPQAVYQVVRFDEEITTVAMKQQALSSRKLQFPDLPFAHKHPTTIKWRLLVARTLTFRAPNDRCGLITTFVAEDEPMTLRDRKHALNAVGDEIASNKNAGKLLLGEESHVNLVKLGLARGVVGPWVLPGNDLPRLVIVDLPDDEPDHVVPIIDYALSTKESLVVAGWNNALKLIKEVSIKLKIRPPTFIMS